jgi:hypothetical protein
MPSALVVVLFVEAGVELADGLAQFLDLCLQPLDLGPTLLPAQLLLHALGLVGQVVGQVMNAGGVQMRYGLADVLEALFHRDLLRRLRRAALATGPLLEPRVCLFEPGDAPLEVRHAV